MPEMEIVTACDPEWAAVGTSAQQAVLPGRLRRLHQAILVYFLDHGDPPGPSWLHAQAGRLGLDPSTAQADLAAADLVHLGQAGQVAVAYPFSGVPTGHRVELAGAPAVWAMCAIDALGIPQMTGRDGSVNFFAHADHARCYLESHPDLTGQLLDLPAAVELARMVFGGLLHPVGGDDQAPATTEP